MRRAWVFACVAACLLLARVCGAVEVAGARVELVEPAGAATVTARMVGKHQLRIDVDPLEQGLSLTIGVRLPVSGPNYWPVEDVVVTDSSGQPVPARHNGTEWEQFTLAVPPKRASYTVRVVRPAGPRPKVFPERERQVSDRDSGLTATIANWYGGRQAALCLRFDDSHPTHLSTVIPALRRYGFRATFLINPGERDERCPPRWRSNFHRHRAEWEAVARAGDQEFGNHTAHHRGATSDEDMEREIGEAAKVIWRLFPNRSKLLALNLGGGTWWVTSRPLRYYLDKYPSFLVTGSLGMDDTYGNRVEAFRQYLERNLAPGRLGWCKAHFHSVGDGYATSLQHFLAVLEIVKQHQSELWVAGLADAYKYLTERRGAKLTLDKAGPRRLALRLHCTTDPTLFDQPLTVELHVPRRWAAHGVTVTDSTGRSVPTSEGRSPDHQTLAVRFDVPPTDATYLVEPNHD